MRTSKARRKELTHAIKLTWSSLDSHLQYAIKSSLRDRRVGEDEHFHAIAIREYAEVILICARELEALAPKIKKFPRAILSNTRDNTLPVGPSLNQTGLPCPVSLLGPKTVKKPSKSKSTQSLIDNPLWP